jgi:hypothetical protein
MPPNVADTLELQNSAIFNRREALRGGAHV